MFKPAKFISALFWIMLISANVFAQTPINRKNLNLGLKILQKQIEQNTENFVVSATSVYTIAAAATMSEQEIGFAPVKLKD